MCMFCDGNYITGTLIAVNRVDKSLFDAIVPKHNESVFVNKLLKELQTAAMQDPELSAQFTNLTMQMTSHSGRRDSSSEESAAPTSSSKKRPAPKKKRNRKCTQLYTGLYRHLTTLYTHYAQLFPVPTNLEDRATHGDYREQFRVVA